MHGAAALWSRYKDLVASSVILGSMITAVMAVGSGMPLWQVAIVFAVSASAFLVIGGMEDLSNRPDAVGARWNASLDWTFAGLGLVSVVGWLSIDEIAIGIASAGVLVALVFARCVLRRRRADRRLRSG